MLGRRIVATWPAYLCGDASCRATCDTFMLAASWASTALVVVHFCQTRNSLSDAVGTCTASLQAKAF